MPELKEESAFKSTKKRTFKRGSRTYKVLHSHKRLQQNVAQLNWAVTDNDEYVKRACRVDEYLTELVNHTYVKYGIKISRRKLFLAMFENFMDKNPIPKNIN
jgi:hypothetical protein